MFLNKINVIITMIFIFISCKESKEENLIVNVYGCIDENASNYNLLANTSDGSCEYSGCTDFISGKL